MENLANSRGKPTALLEMLWECSPFAAQDSEVLFSNTIIEDLGSLRAATGQE